MIDKHYGWAACLAAVFLVVSGQAGAPCGNNAAGFEAWKRAFAGEAEAKDRAKGIAALMGTNYSVGTIRADRGQKSFKLSLDQFMAKRGGPAIAVAGQEPEKQPMPRCSPRSRSATACRPAR